jgi:hypothetical protein
LKKLFNTPLKILAFIAICVAIAVVLFTGGWGIGIGLLILISALLLYVINYIASKTEYGKTIQIGVTVVYVLTGFCYVMKWQEHTTYIFSKIPKEAVGVVFGIEGYPALPATFLWAKAIRMPNSGVIITSTKEEDMPAWQRYQFSDGSVIGADKINWNPNYQFPCIKSKGVVKAWLFSKVGKSDSLVQKHIVEIVNRIDAGKLKTSYMSSSGVSVVDAKDGAYITLQNAGLAYLPDAVTTLPINTIYLAQNKFTSLPPQLYRIKTLHSVYLSANPIKSLPVDLYKLRGLKSLLVGKTEIRVIKTNLSNLDSLEDFDISSNKLTVFPENIKTIPHLRWLSIQENGLKDLSFIDSKLSGLQTLQIYTNKIKSIPDNIHYLRNLKELLIFDNEIDSIPNSIGSLINLEHLEIWNNPIHYISPEIKKLVKLKEMRLDDNYLSEKDKKQLRKWLPSCEIHFQTRTPL